MTDLITPDEIRELKASPRRISWKDVMPGMGLQPPIKLTVLRSGYQVSFTLDSIFDDGTSLEHVIIDRDKQPPDPVDADEIATAILGRCALIPLNWTPGSGWIHYVRIRGLNDSDLEKAYEEGVERGVKMVEAR